jgi:hypothetical protein
MKKQYNTVETIGKSKKSKSFQKGNTDTNKTQIHHPHFPGLARAL